MEMLLLIAGLVLLNAVLAGSEMAFVSLRAGQLRRMRTEGGRGTQVAALAEEPSRLLSTIQVGITLGGFLASATAAVSLAEPIAPHLSALGGAAEPVAILLVTLALTYVTLVFGELAPKRIAQQRSERWTLLAARPLAVLARVAAPLVWLLARSTDATVRLLGFDPAAAQSELTEEEVRDFLDNDPSTTSTHRQILQGAFELDERTVRQVLVPRRDTFVVTFDLAADDALRQLVESGHSRCPVLESEAADHAAHVVHMRDLAAAPAGSNVRDVARAAPVVPETTRVLDLLAQLQRARQQFALVANEYGTYVGIVTVEDILEEIVGELYDEFDPDLGADGGAAMRRADGSYELPGTFPLHDLVDLGIDVPGEVTAATVAGLVLDALGRVPAAGESVRVGGWTFTVEAIEGHAIERVRVQANRRREPNGRS